MNGIVGGVVLLGATLFAVGLYFNLSEPKDLGVRDGIMSPLSSRPNGVSSQAVDEAKRVPALPFKMDLPTSVNAIKAALNAVGAIEIVEEESDYIRAVARSRIFRYRDDVEIYFDAAAQKIHYRSQSRVGHSDLGVNRMRFEQIKSAYESQ